MKQPILSNVDIAYCIEHGIVTTGEALFFRTAPDCNKLQGAYKSLHNKLSERLKFYSGIADKVKTAREQVAMKNQWMKNAKTAARTAYNNQSQLSAI